jgi:trimeric autotransporter adhesin
MQQCVAFLLGSFLPLSKQILPNNKWNHRQNGFPLFLLIPKSYYPFQRPAKALMYKLIIMKQFLKAVSCLLLILAGYVQPQAQSFAINTDGSTANASALLDVKAVDKGVLLPRMSKAQKNAIASPATGLLVFQDAPDSIGFHYYNGAAWVWLANAGINTGWQITGNAGTNAANHFVGTTDNVPLSFRQNNSWLGRWNGSTHNYSIGDSTGSKTTGLSNIAIGGRALFENTAGFGNVALGNASLHNNTTGSRNTAIGDSALFTQGFNGGANFLSDNTAIGSKALFYNQPISGFTGIKNVAIGNEAMYFNTEGGENVAIGVSAMRENLTGAGNTVVGRSANRLAKSGSLNSYYGYNAGYNDSVGSSNTGIGGYALNNHQSGDGNTALGVSSSVQNDTAAYTTSIGYFSAYYNKRDYTTAVGAYAGLYNSSSSSNVNQGAENTMIGYAAMTGNAFGSKNAVLGYKAMAIFEPLTFFSSGAPSRNVAIGDSAMFGNRSNDNVGIGYRALAGINAAGINGHVAVGSRALLNTTATYPNTAIGYSSQDSTTTGYANTSLGSYSLTANEMGYNNTAIGNAAMYEANGNSVNLSNNTAVGNDALRQTRYYGNTAVGASALRNDTAGVYNSAVGYQAMYNNRSGVGNVSLGYNAMFANESSDYNTAIGYTALLRHKRNGFTYNTALGSFAMEQDSTGYQNTGVGTSAFRFNKTGFLNTGVGINAGYYQKESQNTFIGAYAGMGERAPYNNVAADTGNANTGLGAFALYRVANGSNNVALGYYALSGDSSGNNNVAIGSNTLATNTTGSLNTAIGHDADVSSAALTNATAIGANAFIAQSNSMVLGSISGINGAIANTLVGIGTNTPTARLDVDANFKLGNTGSILNEIIKTTVVYDIVSLTVGAVDIQTFTVNNAVAGSTVFISPNGALPNGVTISYARVSAANTVEVKFVNAGTATQDPASNTFYITVIR